jgi:hypothetical protein
MNHNSSQSHRQLFWGILFTQQTNFGLNQESLGNQNTELCPGADWWRSGGYFFGRHTQPWGSGVMILEYLSESGEQKK